MHALLLLYACGGAVDTDTPTSDTAADESAPDDSSREDSDDTAPPCTAAVVSVAPADAALRVALDSVVTVALSDESGTPSVALSSDEGSVTGVTTMVGAVATFTPDQPLSPHLSYTADATVCDATPVSVAFTTNGAPLDVDVTGFVYDLPFAGDDLTWVKPAALEADAFAGYLGESHMLFLVESTGDGLVHVAGAPADNTDNTGFVTTQYRCSELLDFTPADFGESPWFEVGPADASLRIGGTEMPAYDFHLSGYFLPDGSGIEQLELTGLFDTRPLVDGYGFDVCAFAASKGDYCEACPDGEVLCLAMDLVQAVTPRMDGGVVDPDVVPANETCEP